jgi:hypothetical protein
MAPGHVSNRLIDALKVGCEYLEPEAEHWPDDEVVHRLLIKAIDLERQLVDLRPKEPAWVAQHLAIFIRNGESTIHKQLCY